MNTYLPKVSVIVPVYNVETYIEECLLSIMDQTFTDFECIIVDDCGSDNSIAIAQKLIDNYSGPAKFRIVHHEKNGGLSAARNTGITESEGEYLLFVDSDDKIYPHTLDCLYSMVEKYPGVEMVQGNITSSNGNDTFLHYDNLRFNEYYSDNSQISKLMFEGLPCTAWNKLVKREYIEDHNLIFEEGILHEDELWRWDNHLVLEKLAICNETTYWYRLDNRFSIMNNQIKDKSVISKFKIVAKVYDTFLNRQDFEFLFKLVSYDKKLKLWKFIENKKLLKSEIKILALSIDKKEGALLRREMLLWLLPCWFLNNIFFAKFHYEWQKCVLLKAAKSF